MDNFLSGHRDPSSRRGILRVEMKPGGHESTKASRDPGAVTYDSGWLIRCIHPQASLNTYAFRQPLKRPDNATPPPRGFYKAWCHWCMPALGVDPDPPISNPIKFQHCPPQPALQGSGSPAPSGSLRAGTR
ncbi:hypothetical protein BD779DRAFT_1794706 [Infundibulicybe gibba]|nr:hypothetical protein BD779DRAFT_1794706 [Infundibulicybe gibba]